MRVFKARWTAGGKTRETDRWYVELTIGARRWRFPAMVDKNASTEFGRKLERLASFRAAKLPADPELCRWIEELHGPERERLTRAGLLERERSAAGKKLTEHVKDFKAALLARGNTPEYATITAGRVSRVVNACGFRYWSDIDAARIQAHLADLRKPKAKPGGEAGETVPGLGVKSSNDYLAAFKECCRWMVKERRASESPVAHLGGLNARTDRRIERRALTADECRKLLTAAEAGKALYDMSGPDRAMLYRLALSTGLRWNELYCLTRGDFVLDGPRPSVTVRVAYSKHRREDMQPLPHETAAALKDYLADRLPGARAFPMPDRRVGAEIVEADLKAAGIEATDAAGRVADFHALRHTFITNLCNGGVHPKTAQSLARHSSITLTMDRYTHLSVADERAGLDALPDLDAPIAAEARATGTDGSADVQEMNGGKSLPQILPIQGAFQGSGRHKPAQAEGQEADGAVAIKPAPALQNAEDSDMIGASCRSGGIGRRARFRT